MEGAGSGFQQRRVYGESCKGRRPQAGGTAGSDAPEDRQVGSGERILKKKLPEDECERAGFVVAEGFIGSNGFRLSISEQCRLLGIGRSVYYRWRAQACRRSEKQNAAHQQNSGPSCSLKHTSRSLESLEEALGDKEARRKTDLVDLVRTTLQAYRNKHGSGTAGMHLGGMDCASFVRLPPDIALCAAGARSWYGEAHPQDHACQWIASGVSWAEHQQGEQEELQVPLPVAQQADLVTESGLEYRRYLVAAACGGDVSGGDHRPVYEESLVLETEQHAGCLILRRMPARGSGCIWRAGNIP